MNPDAWWMADTWTCVVCGERCAPEEHDENGVPIHERCKVDRDVMQAEAAWHAWSGE